STATSSATARAGKRCATAWPPPTAGRSTCSGSPSECGRAEGDGATASPPLPLRVCAASAQIAPRLRARRAHDAAASAQGARQGLHLAASVGGQLDVVGEQRPYLGVDQTTRNRRASGTRRAASVGASQRDDARGAGERGAVIS